MVATVRIAVAPQAQANKSIRINNDHESMSTSQDGQNRKKSKERSAHMWFKSYPWNYSNKLFEKEDSKEKKQGPYLRTKCPSQSDIKALIFKADATNLDVLSTKTSE